MYARYRIEQWFGRVEQSAARMNREDVCFLMVQTRHLIESADNPQSYRGAAFYADWTVHSALDRSIVCFEVLRDITGALTDNLSPTRPDFTEEVSRIIGFPRLRFELTDLFRRNGLPTVLFDYLENWRDFVMFLLWFLVGQPISFPVKPKGRAQEIRDEMLASPRPHNIVVDALAIIEQNGAYHWVLQVNGDKQVRVMGQVEIAEKADRFLPSPKADDRFNQNSR